MIAITIVLSQGMYCEFTRIHSIDNYGPESVQKITKTRDE